MGSVNLASTLFEMARSQPEALAIALPAKPGRPLPRGETLPYMEINFKSLAYDTNSTCRGLLAWGFVPGDRVVLMIPPGIEFFTVSFALLQAGIIPVLIDPGIGIKYLKKCINETEPAGFIGITKAQIARVLLGWGRSTIKKIVTIGPKLFWGGGHLKKIMDTGRSEAPPVCYDAQPDELAAVLYTSGSTGIPKGVMYTHGNFYHQVEIIRSTFKTVAGDIDLPTFPPFALFNPAAGMSTIIPDMDPTRPGKVDPERIIRAVNQFRVNSLFGSPALIDRVGRYGESNHILLPSLKRVFSAGAPVPAKALRRFSAMLNSGTEILTPYGATEAMPVTSIEGHQLLDEAIQRTTDNGGGVCIGKPVANVTVKLIRITDEPIDLWSDDLEVANGEIGEIAVKGKNVTRAYFNRDRETRLAKIRHGNDFFHRMGDLAYQDADGRLWFCGRKSHRVRTDHRELYTVQCEYIFNKHPAVHRTALVSAGNRALLCVEIDREAANQDKKQIRKELLEWAKGNELTKDIGTILFHPSFPVDIRHNAKIFREKLAAWAASRV